MNPNAASPIVPIGSHVLYLDPLGEVHHALVAGVRLDLPERGTHGEPTLNLVHLTADKDKQQFLDGNHFYDAIERRSSILHASHPERAGKLFADCWHFPDEGLEMKDLHEERQLPEQPSLRGPFAVDLNDSTGGKASDSDEDQPTV